MMKDALIGWPGLQQQAELVGSYLVARSGGQSRGAAGGRGDCSPTGPVGSYRYRGLERMASSVNRPPAGR